MLYEDIVHATPEDIQKDIAKSVYISSYDLKSLLPKTKKKVIDVIKDELG